MWLSVLGVLSIQNAEQSIVVSAAKQRIVLAALLLRAGRVVSFDELADLVWDGAPPAAARATLRNYVKRLRQVLGDTVGSRIITRDPGYLIEIDDHELDLLRLAVLYREGGSAVHAGRWPQAATALTEALGLWHGAPLADIPSQILHRDEAPRLEQLRVQALTWRIEADLHLARHDELVPELEALTAAQPLREHFHAQLMTALYRSGRQAEALDAYQRARRGLLDELGIEPGAQLKELHRRILTGDPRLILRPADAGRSRAIVPRQLPAVIRHFVGREAELRTLSAQMESAASIVISAIGGTAGVGKTALAVQWAHQVADRFPNGQLYVNLRGFDPSGSPMTTGEAIRSLLDSLDVPAERIPVGIDTQTALYRSILAGRPMLVLLDNARDARQVRPLLPGSRKCLVVVTSRNQLTGLVASDDAYLLNLAALTEAEARELLIRRLGASRVLSDPKTTDELIALCARLPLALGIAAARAGSSLATLAAEIGDARDRLNLLDAGEAATSMRAVFSWSYQQLSEPAARVFRLLGVAPGPDITIPATASLAGVSRTRAGALIGELTGSNILVEHRPGRFTFHDLLRAYAAEQADACDLDGERRAALHRLLDHYLHTAHAAAMVLRPTQGLLPLAPPGAGVTPEELHDQGPALAWCDAEHAALLAAITRAAAAGFDTHAWQLPWTLSDFFDMRAHWHDWAATQQIALAAALRRRDLHAQAHAHRNLGRARVRLGELAEAGARLRQALELYRRLGDRVGQAQTHNGLAQVLENLGRPEQALIHAQRTLELYRDLGHRPGQARALNSVGWGHAQLGDHRQALDHCRQALDLLRELHDRCGEAATWDSLGYVHHHLGGHDQAISCYQRALALYRELGELYNEADTLSRLGDTHRASGDLTAAHETWRRAQTIFDDHHHSDADLVRAKLETLGGVRVRQFAWICLQAP